MSGVFRNIDPAPPHRQETLAGWREGGGSIYSSEDARHCAVLFICKYFVVLTFVTFRDPKLSSQSVQCPASMFWWHKKTSGRQQIDPTWNCLLPNRMEKVYSIFLCCPPRYTVVVARYLLGLSVYFKIIIFSGSRRIPVCQEAALFSTACIQEVFRLFLLTQPLFSRWVSP